MPIDSDQDYDSSRRLLRDRKRGLQPDRKLRSKPETESRFLEDFDPDKSNREKRKLRLTKNVSSLKVPSSYDNRGRIRTSRLDVCDCMDDKCPGCWFECESCFSTKCGVQCRVNRKYFYECIIFDGKDKTIRNPHCPPSNSDKKTTSRAGT